jgi:hypothetical protein
MGPINLLLTIGRRLWTGVTWLGEYPAAAGLAVIHALRTTWGGLAIAAVALAEAVAAAGGWVGGVVLGSGILDLGKTLVGFPVSVGAATLGYAGAVVGGVASTGRAAVGVLGPGRRAVRASAKLEPAMRGTARTVGNSQVDYVL